MELLEIEKKLKQIPAESLSKVLKVGLSMARKYRFKPHLQTPNAIQAMDVYDNFGIPFQFWRDIKIYKESHTNVLKRPK